VSITVYDITIIGGGPIGLFAAAYAGELGALCNLIESRFHLGGVIMAAYPGKDVYNFPGIANIKGRDLINSLITKSISNGMLSRLGELVHTIGTGSRGIITVKSNVNEYISSTVIITTGLKAHYSPFINYLKVKDWDGTGVYDNWPPPFTIKGKSVGIFYGALTELDIPAYLAEGARDWFLVVEDTGSSTQIPKKGTGQKSEAQVYRRPWEVREIRGAGSPARVLLRNSVTSEIRELKMDVAIAFYDQQAVQTVYSNSGIEMIGQQIRVNQRMQTSLKRVYAAGDIAWYPGKVMALSAGIYEAKIAVKNALKMI
jgi:thioredoxin reductase (NADPH)